jgi:DNA-binding NtrC family response regulator
MKENLIMSDDSQTIVVVDDEEIVLTSISSFLSLETDYEVKTFLSAAEALEYIKSNNTDLVISDYLMPEMDGISFLAKVRNIAPEVPRIILTGYADKENAIKAINDVGLFQYIEKPWDNADLLLIIRNGMEKQKLLKKLQGKIDEINKAYGEMEKIQREILKTFV